MKFTLQKIVLFSLLLGYLNMPHSINAAQAAETPSIPNSPGSLLKQIGIDVEEAKWHNVAVMDGTCPLLKGGVFVDHTRDEHRFAFILERAISEQEVAQAITQARSSTTHNFGTALYNIFQSNNTRMIGVPDRFYQRVHAPQANNR